MPAGKVIVLTGEGKGKTTSALGRCLQGWLEGKKINIFQFIKGEKSYGELIAKDYLGESFKLKQVGLGFVKNSNRYPIDLHKQYAARGLDEALKEIKSNHYDIIVLDEINYAIHFNLLTEEQVIGVIGQKPDNLTLILTGRYARRSVIERSDEAYEFVEVKHYSTKGIMARQGIEY
ncbi:MAG: cob(I)yrinic acid a,c-diamide adenosyltransferase [Desulfocucumaceae bacterium]